MSRIEDLERRLAQDPNSKIFAQLAEEYRKAGMLEEAIATCRDGLSKHPNYFSARVALGRALLESGQHQEASEEFEQVLSLVPENILANRFLGETYHKLGRLEDALLKYRVTHTLAPDDVEVVELINQVEDELQAASAPPPAPVVDDPTAIDFALEETADSTLAAPEPAPEPEAPQTVTPPEFGPEGEAVFELEEDVGPPIAAQSLGPVQPPVESAAFEPTVLEWEAEAPPAAPSPPPEASTAAPPPIPPSRSAGEKRDAAEPMGAPVSLPAAAGGARAPLEQAPMEQQTPKENIATPRLAELYASQGHLDKALAVYRELLDSRPGDLKLRERVEELEMLIRATEEAARKKAAPAAPAESEQELLVTIHRLETWLAAIRQS